VFPFSLSLAFSVLLTALPVASVASNATVAVCFAPEDDCAEFAERAIKGAEREILVSAYRLTVGSGIVGALIRAKERGVDVRVIADRGAPCGRASGIEPLAAAGVPVWIDDAARIAHAKTMVIDGVVTLQGSYNWTHAAAENSEDLNRSPPRPLRKSIRRIGASGSGYRCPSFSARIGAAIRRRKLTDAQRSETHG